MGPMRGVIIGAAADHALVTGSKRSAEASVAPEVAPPVTRIFPSGSNAAAW